MHIFVFFRSWQKYNWQFWYQIPTMLPPYCCLNVDAERLPIDCRLLTGIHTLLNIRTESFKEKLPPDNSDRQIIIFEVDMDPKNKKWFSYTIIPIFLYIFFKYLNLSVLIHWMLVNIVWHMLITPHSTASVFFFYVVYRVYVDNKTSCMFGPWERWPVVVHHIL